MVNYMFVFVLTFATWVKHVKRMPFICHLTCCQTILSGTKYSHSWTGLAVIIKSVWLQKIHKRWPPLDSRMRRLYTKEQCWIFPWHVTQGQGGLCWWHYCQGVTEEFQQLWQAALPNVQSYGRKVTTYILFSSMPSHLSGGNCKIRQHCLSAQ